MLRLTVMSRDRKEAVLKVDGWVAGADVALLEEEGNRLLREAERLILDLEDAKFIDEGGMTLLKNWSGDRLVLRGGSMFLQMLLEKHGLAHEF